MSIYKSINEETNTNSLFKDIYSLEQHSINTLFTQAFVGGNVSGSYIEIPTYQRAYEWEKKQVRQFFEDIYNVSVITKEQSKYVGYSLDTITLNCIMDYNLDSKKTVLADGRSRLLCIISNMLIFRDWFLYNLIKSNQETKLIISKLESSSKEEEKKVLKEQIIKNFLLIDIDISTEDLSLYFKDVLRIFRYVIQNLYSKKSYSFFKNIDEDIKEEFASPKYGCYNVLEKLLLDDVEYKKFIKDILYNNNKEDIRFKFNGDVKFQKYLEDIIKFPLSTLYFKKIKNKDIELKELYLSLIDQIHYMEYKKSYTTEDITDLICNLNTAKDSENISVQNLYITILELNLEYTKLENDYVFNNIDLFTGYVQMLNTLIYCCYVDVKIYQKLSDLFYYYINTNNKGTLVSEESKFLTQLLFDMYTGDSEDFTSKSIKNKEKIMSCYSELSKLSYPEENIRIQPLYDINSNLGVIHPKIFEAYTYLINKYKKQKEKISSEISRGIINYTRALSIFKMIYTEDLYNNNIIVEYENEEYIKYKQLNNFRASLFKLFFITTGITNSTNKILSPILYVIINEIYFKNNIDYDFDIDYYMGQNNLTEYDILNTLISDVTWLNDMSLYIDLLYNTILYSLNYIESSKSILAATEDKVVKLNNIIKNKLKIENFRVSDVIKNMTSLLLSKEDVKHLNTNININNKYNDLKIKLFYLKNESNESDKLVFYENNKEYIDNDKFWEVNLKIEPLIYTIEEVNKHKVLKRQELRLLLPDIEDTNFLLGRNLCVFNTESYLLYVCCSSKGAKNVNDYKEIYQLSPKEYDLVSDLIGLYINDSKYSNFNSDIFNELINELKQRGIDIENNYSLELETLTTKVDYKNNLKILNFK